MKILPDEQYPKDKIAESLELKADEASKKQEYDELIANADKHFGEADYESALAGYQRASSLIPGDPYPPERIEEIGKY